MQTVRLVGRRSSLFTRVARIYAETLGIPVALEVVPDMKDLNPASYGGNPSRKLPTLLRAGSMVIGTENICRALSEMADHRLHLVWPEHLCTDVSRNAQESTWYAMSAQVQLVMGTLVGGLPSDNIYFVKARAGLESALNWLDEHFEEVRAKLPNTRDLSLFEATLFCLIEHLQFRATVSPAQFRSLLSFTQDFARLPAARATPYVFDT